MRVMATIMLASLSGLACSRGSAPSVAQPAPTTTPAQDYARYCALCHGEDREGYAADNAPSLRSPELLGAGQGTFLIKAIAFGRPGTPMAAFLDEQGGPMSGAQISAMHDWLVVEAEPVKLDPTPISGDPKQGAEVYEAHCASCHGEQGQGGTGPSLSNPVLLATASDALLRDAIVRGRSDTPMQPYGGVLGESSINDLVAFLRSLEGGWEAPAPVKVEPPPPERAVVNPEGPISELTVREGLYVPAAEVHEALQRGDRMVLLDARPMSDWQRGHIPGALPVPFYGDFSALIPHLPKDTYLVAYCACPHAASGRVAKQLRAKGFDRAVVLDEGILVWKKRGYPMVSGSQTQ